MAKKVKKSEKADVHKELEGFSVKVNELGEIETNYTIEQLNAFLNRQEAKKDEEE